MASSQVEIASSSPFGYVLDRCCARDSNAYQKKFKHLVQSHLASCISNKKEAARCTNLPLCAGSGERPDYQGLSKKTFPSDSCENSQNHADLWVHKATKCDEKNANNSPKKRSKADEKWDKARNMIFSMDKVNQENCLDVPNLGGFSNLVRKWKDFENSEFVGSPQKGFDESSCSIVKSESFDELESDDISKDSDVKESERLGVADIIKKLTFDNGNVVVVANGGSLPRVRTSTMDHSEGQRCNFSPVLSSPRFVRGRQAFSDLLLQMERDRQRELEGLVERKAVSKFQQRGRIQAVLRVRLIRHGAEVRGGGSVNCSASESNKSTHSAIMYLREKFNTVGQHGLADSRNTSKEVAKITYESGSLPSTPNRQRKENFYREFKGLTSSQSELARSNSAKAGTGFSLYQQREEDPLQGPGVADSRSTSIPLGDNTRDPCISEKENHHEEVSEQVSFQKVTTSMQARYRFSSHQQREGDQPGEEDSRSTPRALGENTRYPKEENHHKPRNTHKEVVDNIPTAATFCISNQPREENHYEELCKKLSSRNLSKNQKEMACSAKISEGSCRLNQHEMDPNHQEVSTSLPSFTSQAQSLDNTSSEESHSRLLDFVESARPHKDRAAIDCTNPQSDGEDKVANQCLVESESGSVSDYSLTASGWDELQSNEDWISNISRPRKEWEGLRQERYQEMLDPYSDNHDIQQLLHRKSVSLFLTSGLREQIDRIMASRSQQLPNSKSSHVEEEIPSQAAEDEQEEVEQNAREEEDEVREQEEEEDEWSYDDDSEVIIHQNTSSQTLQSWNTNHDQEVTDYSYHFPSPSSLLSQSSKIPSGRHPSTEMELIYEMRGHMEQLHQEIFEIRRSMKSCMNMQMKLQRSIKQDIADAISQLGQKSRGNSDNKGSNKGKCCICCEEPVDSLLYRCGHMCTCFKCAHELISGSGICPICRAPIMDVVRAYAQS